MKTYVLCGRVAALRTNLAFVPSLSQDSHIERLGQGVVCAPAHGMSLTQKAADLARRWLKGMTFTLLLKLTCATAAPGDLDLSFAPGAAVDYAVLAVAAQSDGKVLIGGGFSSVQGIPRGGIARLTANGALDATYLNDLPGANDRVWCLARQGDGKVVIGGFFNSVNYISRNAIARLNADGSLDAGFLDNEAGADGAVYSAAIQADGKIVIAGDFTSVNGVACNSLARLNVDGTLDTNFLDGLTGGDLAAFSLALQSNGQILVGGWFTTFNGAPRNHLARLNADGSLDTGFLNNLSGADGRVWALAVQSDGKVIIGGDFTTVNGTGRKRLARLNTDGSLDTAFLNGQAGADDAVWALAVQANGKIIVGGQFTAFNGTNRHCLARLNTDGTLDSSFLNAQAGADNTVRSLAIQGDGRILLGGQFGVINQVVSANVARLLAGWPPPLIQDQRIVNGQFTFNISGAADQIAVIQASTNLLIWNTLATNILSSNPTPFSVPYNPRIPRRFFRVITPD